MLKVHALQEVVAHVVSIDCQVCHEDEENQPINEWKFAMPDIHAPVAIPTIIEPCSITVVAVYLLRVDRIVKNDSWGKKLSQANCDHFPRGHELRRLKGVEAQDFPTSFFVCAGLFASGIVDVFSVARDLIDAIVRRSQNEVYVDI